MSEPPTVPPDDEFGPIQDPDPPDPKNIPPRHPPEGWSMRLNPTQQKVFDSIVKYVLAAGEKGSGKSIACLAALVRHCYEENDALALIIAPAIRTGKEGVIYDLNWVLDVWQNGNWDPTDLDRRRRLDDGLGEEFQFTEPTLDPQTKDRVIFVRNIHGTWSKIILVSIPYAEVVEKRMKSLSPSFVYVDEITELDSIEYFKYVAQQIGRRRGIRGPQQYFASCNPEGPSHWVYKVWWQDCLGEDGNRKPAYRVFHVPVHENIANLPPGYIEGLEDLYKDPVDRERLLRGKWIDRPSGLSIFGNFFVPGIHVRGNAKEKEGLRPHPDIPIIIGYDPGPMNYCVTFEQMVPTKERVVWKVFDELNYVGEFTHDQIVVNDILKRMDHWHTFLAGRSSFVHIGPEDAFNQRRHDGSYDATRLTQLSNRRIRLRSCPQAKQSVPTRMQMVNTMFIAETLFISAMCPYTIEAVRLLASEKPKDNGKYNENAALTPKRSPYLHPIDSMTYPIYYLTLMPARFSMQTAKTEEQSPGVYRLGMGA